jgi:type II secretory pathway pseudopilin PulG
MRTIDSFAAEMIPIRLLVSIAIVAAVAVLVGIGMGMLRTNLAQQQVEQECSDLLSSLDTMVQSGAPRDLEEGLAAAGTMRVQSLVLPDNLLYISFGGDPDAANTGVLHPLVSEDGSVIVYKVQDGSKQFIWLPRGIYRFREGYLSNHTWTLVGDGESYILNHGGTCTLVFELVEKNHKIYILIYGNNDLE